MIAALVAVAPLLLALSGGARADSSEPVPAEPAERLRQAPREVTPNYPFDGWNSRLDWHWQMRPVPRGDGPVSPLRRAAEEIDILYAYDDRLLRLGDYLDRHPVTGLLIARGDTILFERYRHERTEEHRFLSYSLAKTVTALLVGVALQEGAIRSLDDRAEAYVPELAGTEYGATPIRALLRMRSGVAFRETYLRDDDIGRLFGSLSWPSRAGAVEALRPFDTRVAPPGERFSYSSAETEVLGLVVARATGVPLAEYLSTRIWRKLGAEADAAWAVDAGGQELAFCCAAARLRDWARLGLMLARDGEWNGAQVVPRAWLLEMTTRPEGGRGAGTYGYQVWLVAGERRIFALRGIHGQAILVDPASRLVMVHMAARSRPAGDPAALEGVALWFALVAQFGRP
jgi:CubicO group peptidase (beta-lactamase class C family)